ncbi:MAG: CsgG/HfaB family protein [Desulfobacterota bacterium]|nr:CsgG/HfaB family protein [Thermodesulfobacteriota bacterium]
MRKRDLTGTIFFLCGLWILTGCATSPPGEQKVETIAVWDLDDLSPAKGTRLPMGEILAGKIIEFLKERREYVVVERQRLLLALEELRLGSTALVDEATRLRLGKMLGAKQMVFGGYQVIGGQMRLDLRLVEVETGRVRRAVQKTSASGSLEGWMEATRKAAEELLR